jgi:hypothetical protein
MSANVTSQWVDGNLVFSDEAGTVLLTIDALNNRISTPSISATAIAGSLSGGNVNPQVAFTAGENLSAGDLIYISGWDGTNGRYAMSKADADAANPLKCALFICNAAVNQGAAGVAVGEKVVGSLNTNAATVGDPAYLSTTAGGWALSVPTGGGQCIQQVGVVTVKSATVGEIKFFPFYSKTISVNTTE